MKLTDEAYRKLVETTARADSNGCCGCMRSGFSGGMVHAAYELGFEIDTSKFYEDVAKRSNELWDEENPDA
jgi:hypothetical protein